MKKILDSDARLRPLKDNLTPPLELVYNQHIQSMRT